MCINSWVMVFLYYNHNRVNAEEGARKHVPSGPRVALIPSALACKRPLGHAPQIFGFGLDWQAKRDGVRKDVLVDPVTFNPLHRPRYLLNVVYIPLVHAETTRRGFILKETTVNQPLRYGFERETCCGRLPCVAIPFSNLGIQRGNIFAFTSPPLNDQGLDQLIYTTGPAGTNTAASTPHGTFFLTYACNSDHVHGHLVPLGQLGSIRTSLKTFSGVASASSIRARTFELGVLLSRNQECSAEIQEMLLDLRKLEASEGCIVTHMTLRILKDRTKKGRYLIHMPRVGDKRRLHYNPYDSSDIEGQGMLHLQIRSSSHEISDHLQSAV
ncbi:hypothetical protein VNO77_07556 [Canavalia gladiata]|uniref:Uncharacterized protein n=1 Tax=Canavalia gladiata TaxID=3824 RepID=A0AAN9M993_CANGL